MTALHSTVPANFSSIAGLASVECRGCSAALLVEFDAPALTLCNACIHAQQDHDAGSIATLVRKLASGAGDFDRLSPDERRVHLSQLATVVTHARLQLAKGDDEATAAILAGPVSKGTQAVERGQVVIAEVRRQIERANVVLAHYESTAADEPSPEECEAIYAMEEVLDREEILATEETAGSEWR